MPRTRIKWVQVDLGNVPVRNHTVAVTLTLTPVSGEPAVYFDLNRDYGRTRAKRPGKPAGDVPAEAAFELVWDH